MKLKVFLLSLIFFTFSVSSSFAILLDLTGQGGDDPTSIVIEFDTLDWGPGSALLDGLEYQPGSDFTLYAQANLSSFYNRGVQLSIPLGYELTFVMGYDETFTDRTTEKAEFELSKNGGLNFFAIYLDNTPNANPLDGTGYTDGVKIAWGNVVESSGKFSIEVDSDGNPILEDLDQNSWNGDNWDGKQSVVGTGQSEIIAVSGPLHYLDNYFINIPSDFYLSYIDRTNVSLPFGYTDPSKQYYDGSNFIQVGPEDLGYANGLGSMMLLETDGRSIVSAVPEPATMFLLGTGLIGFVGIGRRKFKRNKA